MKTVTCKPGSYGPTFLLPDREQSSQSTEKEDKADMQREAEIRDPRRCQVTEHFLIPSSGPF